MANLQEISRMKFGIIDAEYANSVVNAVNDYNSKKDSIAKMLSRAQKQKPEKLLVQITESIPWQNISLTRFGGVVEDIIISWKYKIKTVSLLTAAIPIAGDTSPLLTTTDFGTSYGDGSAGYCYNVAELSNWFTYQGDSRVFGVDVTGEAYPAGFTPQPAPLGSILFAERYICEDSGMIFLFDRQGSHDGTCA